MQLLTATLTSQPREVNTKHGERTVADARLPDGREIAIWRPARDPNLLQYHKGSEVQLTKDRRGKFSLVDTVPASLPQPQPAAPTLEGTDKAEIAQYVSSMASLYSYCYEEAAKNLAKHEAPEQAIRGAASSLFIAAQRKFDLA